MNSLMEIDGGDLWTNLPDRQRRLIAAAHTVADRASYIEQQLADIEAGLTSPADKDSLYIQMEEAASELIQYAGEVAELFGIGVIVEEGSR